jgi:transposase
MAKLYFAELAGSAPALQLLDAQKLASRKWLEENQNHLEDAAKLSRFERMLYRYRVAQTQTTLKWLSQCRADLAEDDK